MSETRKIYVIAGEPSGDLHGKNLVAAIQALRPGMQWMGVGGDGLKALGMKLTRHIRDTSFMGFSEVLKNLGKIKRLFRDVKQDIANFQPDLVILIDYPGFNLKMARHLKEKGIPVVYYISPQVWAWKKGRVKTVQECVARMLTILPFEKEFYAKEGVEVDFVGHPLLDEIDAGRFDREALKHTFAPDGRKLVALLPGSRKQEIQRMLPVMLEAASRFPHCQFVVAGAPSQDLSFYETFLQGKPVQFVSARTYDLLAAADYAFVCSGTATLETALFGVPETVCYAGGWLSVQIARRLIQVKYISLVNLIMDRVVVTELIQQDLTAAALEKELKSFLENPERVQRFRSDYAELVQRLGTKGASERGAQAVIEVLEG